MFQGWNKVLVAIKWIEFHTFWHFHQLLNHRMNWICVFVALTRTKIASWHYQTSRINVLNATLLRLHLLSCPSWAENVWTLHLRPHSTLIHTIHSKHTKHYLHPNNHCPFSIPHSQRRVVSTNDIASSPKRPPCLQGLADKRPLFMSSLLLYLPLNSLWMIMISGAWRLGAGEVVTIAAPVKVMRVLNALNSRKGVGGRGDGEEVGAGEEVHYRDKHLELFFKALARRLKVEQEVQVAVECAFPGYSLSAC